MVAVKKPGDSTNGVTKQKAQQNMSFQGKYMAAAAGNKSDGKQNGNATGLRTDSSISGARPGQERTLQRWVSDAPENTDGSLESLIPRSGAAAPWDQFAEHDRRFGTKSTFDEEIYTTPLNRNAPNYKQRDAEAARVEREILRSSTANSHVLEERISDNLSKDNNGDEEDKYSGVRRQDFPPSSSANKYTPPARRAPTGLPTVLGAPVDPAIISTQKPSTAKEVKPSPSPKPAAKSDAPTPPAATTAEASASVETKPKATIHTPTTSITRTASPAAKPEGVPNHTATVEKDVTAAFKTFATQQRKDVDRLRNAKLRNDREVKLNELKKFADSFKLDTPVPSDLVSIIAKDPAKQKEIQEKAKRNAEQATASPAPPITTPGSGSDANAAPRPAVASHGSSPSSALNNRQANARGQNILGQAASQSLRNDRPSPNQQLHQNRNQPRTLNQQLQAHAKQFSQPQMPIPIPEQRLPPTGPSDPNFSRRSSGVASNQGRLNPSISEFRPSVHAAAFTPSTHASSGSSPRAVPVEPPVVVRKSLLSRKPVPASERPSVKGKFNALRHILSEKPPPGKDWKGTGGIKPAYETSLIHKAPTEYDPQDHIIYKTYQQFFDAAPYPAQAMSPTPAQIVPQFALAHQHQLPPHLQQNVNMAPRPSPRQMPMAMHSQHAPNGSFNGDDHRMVPSHSAQSFASPRMQTGSFAASPSMNGQAQMAYNPQMMQMPGQAPPMQGYRSMSQNNHFMPPQQQGMPQMIMQNPNQGFMNSGGMAPGPHMMYPQGNQFMGSNGQPPMAGPNGYPSPARGGAPMMMNQGSQQGHQNQMYGRQLGNGMGPSLAVQKFPRLTAGLKPVVCCMACSITNVF
ncbi:hypothetical protein BJ878DRAFT_202030 [Calycina marina]|uniref:LsmAD domain-containing protein n=1 Tax=Calycina marina TaxID=1763456 RepID=A0A9P7YZC2_9HELO|nr:hypothetical protein BJ878DRAFT_202030 [Calycina marina]